MISTDDSNDCLDNVVYLLSVNKSPTKMAAVNEVLYLVKVKADPLELAKVELVLDHTIHCKALEIISNPMKSNLKNAINLRKGGLHLNNFHICDTKNTS